MKIVMDITNVISSTVQGRAAYWVELPPGSPLIGEMSTSGALTPDDNLGVVYEYEGEGKTLVIEDCQDAWNEDVPANTTAAASVAWFKVGTSSVELAYAAAAAAGVITTEVIAVTTLVPYKYIDLWVKCTVDAAAGDFQLMLDDTAKCVSALETINLPALEAGVEQHVRLTLANPETDLTLISVGIKLVTDLGACSLFVDDIRAATSGERVQTQKTVAGYIRGTRWFRLAAGIAADQTQVIRKLIVNYVPLSDITEVPAS